MKKYTAAAIVTIRRPNDMTPSGRKRVAAWLRKTADDLAKYGKDYGPGFRARYLHQ